MVGDESAGVFAGYRIEGLIRHGGMASVYRARHLVLQRTAALKVLTPALARDQRFRARFLGESRTAASLDHPHIVPIYDAGEADGALFIAMRLIEGSDLGTMLGRETRLEPRRVVEILGQVAGALDAAHGRGLVHRDVKPSNILISGAPGSEHAYLTDFGITKELAAAGLTGTSEFVGTLAYMCPEQIEGMPLDGRADVYALGCVLHECLTGATPFGSDTLVGVMHAHLTKPPPRPTAVVPSLPEGLDAVVATAMAKRPDDRYPSCAAMVEAARAALDAPRRRAAPPPFVVAKAGPVTPPPAALRQGNRGGRWARRWPALLTVAATLLLVTAMAVGSLRGSPAPAPTHSPQTGVVPPAVLSPLPLIGTTSTPSPAPPSATPHAVVVTLNASPSATARPTATPAATAGPPSPTAAGPPTPAPTTAPAPGATPWPASPPTNATTGCEPGWSWSCLPPGRCHTVAHYSQSEQIPGAPDMLIPVTVGADGSVCARWSNPGIQGALLDSGGKTVGGVSGANAGFTVYGLTPGATYRVALHHADGPSDRTALQINQG
ncbi:MAG TPA: serine/threonine-protein kinase [Candidatus Dormibacteraeota bacterium]|nr:serine/threonine-protein kinase [Candidatus Dormibacteraeota bacterium]